MAFNHIKEKIRDKLDQPLPDLLLLPDGGGRKGTMDLSSTLDPGMEVEEEEVKGRDRGREISAETIKRQKEVCRDHCSIQHCHKLFLPSPLSLLYS